MVMKELSSDKYKDGMRLRFVDEWKNEKNRWWVAIGETPFFWLVRLRHCEGGYTSAVHCVPKSEVVPYDEKKAPTADAVKKAPTADAAVKEEVDEFI